MGGHEIDIDLSGSDEVEGFRGTAILPSDILEPDFLAAESADVEGYSVGIGDSEDEEFSAWFEKVHGLVEGFLAPAAFENRVHLSLTLQDALDDIRLIGIPSPIRSGPSCCGEPFGNFIRRRYELDASRPGR